MKLLEFEFEDFMSHRHTVIDCTKFQSVLIIGQTRNNLRKSMGVGKTTIFKGIEYGFFNYAPFNMEKVVRHGAEKCKARIDFEVNTGTYRLVRARTKKGKADLRLYKMEQGTWTDITQKTAKETEAELAKIIGISHGAWRASILFAQADLHGLASVTPRERKAMLKEPLQILIYNEFEKLSKKRSVAALKVVERTKTLIEALGSPDEDIAVASRGLEQANLLKVERQNELTRTRNQLESTKTKLSKLLEVSSQDPIPVRQALTVAKQQVLKTEQNINQLAQQLRNDLTTKVQNDQASAKAQQQLTELEQKQTELLAKTLRTRDLIQADIQRMNSKDVEGSGLLISLTKESEKLGKAIPDKDLCDLCKQPVSQEHRANCEEKRQTDLTETLIRIDQTKKVLAAVRAKKSVFETELADLVSHERSLDVVANSITQKRAELEHAKKSSALLFETVKARTNESENLKTVLVDLQTQQAELENKLNEMLKETNKAETDQLKFEIHELTRTVTKFEQDINATEVKIGMVTQQIESKKADLEKLAFYQQELKAQGKHYSRCLKAQQVFSPTGVPAWIINTILDDLQIEANRILAEIRPDIELNFSLIKTRTDGNQEDTLDIFYRINGVEHDYEQLSGGQKVIVALTLKMAMSHVIQHRIGVDIKLLNLDEVDSQFDDEAMDAFVDIIKKWQTKLTIFVVTHNAYLKSKFQHAILVEGDDVNGSSGKLTYN